MLVGLRLFVSASHVSGTRQTYSLQGLLESQVAEHSGHDTSLGICLQSSSRVATWHSKCWLILCLPQV